MRGNYAIMGISGYSLHFKDNNFNFKDRTFRRSSKIIKNN
jgi:hypothetical protein